MITLKSYAKVNLSLDLVGKREDGYHLLRTVMQTVSLCDIIKMKRRRFGISVSCNLRYIPTDGRNIVYKVAQAFFDYTGLNGGVSLNLKKHIPCGAGLGGGSSNGAAVLEGLCRLYDIEISPGERVKLTERIGTDIPFFVYGGTALCEGIGEQVTPQKPMPECWFVISKPRVSLSTAAVFSSELTAQRFGRGSTDSVLSALEKGSVRDIFSGAQNALEPASVSLCPVINDIKRMMYEGGACFSMMSGSGSAVYGVFTSHSSAARAYAGLREKFADTYIAKPVRKSFELISDN